MLNNPNAKKSSEQPTALIQDLDAVPLPGFKFLNLKKYFVAKRKLSRLSPAAAAPTHAASASPAKCSVRSPSRSPKNVLMELEWCKRVWRGRYRVSDDTFTSTVRAWLKSETNDRAQTKAALGMRNPRRCCNKETLDIMAKAHCDEINVRRGAACLNGAILKKGVTNESNPDAKMGEEAGCSLPSQLYWAIRANTRNPTENSEFAGNLSR
jgi:hypothetical protein